MRSAEAFSIWENGCDVSFECDSSAAINGAACYRFWGASSSVRGCNCGTEAHLDAVRSTGQITFRAREKSYLDLDNAGIMRQRRPDESGNRETWSVLWIL